MNHASRNRLTPCQLDLFLGETIFESVARAVCRAGCLPRKELFEAWKVARRVRRQFRGGARHRPCPAAECRQTADGAGGRLAGRVELRCGEIEEVTLTANDLEVSVHVCGALTDQVIDRAIAARALVAVLPCCQNLAGAELRGVFRDTSSSVQ